MPRIRSVKNVDFLRGDITRLERIDDRSMDGVINTIALHHLPAFGDLSACCREISRVLRPGGALYRGGMLWQTLQHLGSPG